MVLARYDGNAWLLEGGMTRHACLNPWAAISDTSRRVRAFGRGATMAEAVDDAVRDYFDTAETARSTSDDNAVRALHSTYLRNAKPVPAGWDCIEGGA